MGVWAKMLLNDFAFTATTQDLNVPADKIKYLDIMGRVLSNTSQPTKAAIKAMISNIVLKLGGIRICNMSYTDLVALNALWMGRTPLLVQVPGAINVGGFVGPARIPLYILKQGREFSAQFEYLAVLNGLDPTLDVKYTYKDTDFPDRRNLHYAYETFCGVGAASVRINISRVGADLVGILIYNEHDGCADAGLPAEPEVSEMDLVVDDRVVYSDIWTCRGDEKATVDHTDDTSMGVQNDNYQWISFEEEPWPADNLWALTRNIAHFAGGTASEGAFRLICVYVEP